MSYSKKDVAEDTGVSTGRVSETWHHARDVAAGSGELSERNENKTSDSEGGGFLNFLFRLAGFGKSDE